MANVLSSGMSSHFAALAGSASDSVTLHRGAKQTTGVKATKAPVRTESTPDFNIDINNADWIIQRSLYRINGEVTEPQKNDVLEEADGQKWQVLPLGNEPEARLSDQYGNAWRIHYK